MGVFDKLKNALFEVEYVEVEEKPKKEKKSKHHFKKEKDEKKEAEKPIAKKIVLPKKEDKIEQLEEEELKDEDFEIRPKDETIKEPKHTFKFMDDEDFEVVDEPKIVEAYAVEELENNTLEEKKHDEEKREEHNHNVRPEPSHYSFEEKPKVESGFSVKESRPYGVDNSYKVPVYEYGTYEKKEEKQYFKPSPIISPIYGILDKNYKKEDVVSKKEIRITSNYSRTNVNVDDIRNKAFGRRGNKVEKTEPENNTFDIEEDDDNLLVDLTDEKDRPEVKEVTVGDAMEYFQDLGLEYNVDYVDASKEKKPQKKQVEEEKKVEKVEEKKEEVKPQVKEKKQEPLKEEKTTVKVEDESKKNEKQDVDDDNLFDLIDSMYSEDN